MILERHQGRAGGRGEQAERDDRHERPQGLDRGFDPLIIRLCVAAFAALYWRAAWGEWWPW